MTFVTLKDKWLEILLLLLDGEHKKDIEVSSLSASAVHTCSASICAASDSVMSQLLNSVHPLQDFCERSSAKQYSHPSALVEDVREFPPVLSPAVQELEPVSSVSGDSHVHCESSSLALIVNDDVRNRDNASLKMDHVEALEVSREWLMNAQSLAVNSSLHKSDDSVADTSSVITDSGVDSSMLSSRLCLSEISSTAEVDSSALQEIASKPKRAFHGRSASEGGSFTRSERFPNISQPEYHRRYEQGKK